VAAARILVITNRKGGTGKTSMAVNLASEYAARGRKVLLIDLDSQSHCAVGLGVPPVRGAASAQSFLAGQNSLRDALRLQVLPGLDLVPADPLFNHNGSGDTSTALGVALQAEGLLEDYDLVLLDTPPSLDGLLLNALCAADRVLVPFVPHFLSGEGVRQLARVIFRVASRGMNDKLKVLGFVPVMLDTRIGQHREVCEGLGHQFGHNRLLPGIRNDIRVAEAFGRGKPVRQHAAHCRAAQDFAVVADAIDRMWVSA